MRISSFRGRERKKLGFPTNHTLTSRLFFVVPSTASKSRTVAENPTRRTKSYPKTTWTGVGLSIDVTNTQVLFWNFSSMARHLQSCLCTSPPMRKHNYPLQKPGRRICCWRKPMWSCLRLRSRPKFGLECSTVNRWRRVDENIRFSKRGLVASKL